MNKYAQYFAIESQFKKIGVPVNRSELIADFTNDRKTGLSELTPFEYKEFIKAFQKSFNELEKSSTPEWQNTQENQMRRKIISLFVHKMDYSMDGLDSWCISHGAYKKKLNAHNFDELVVLVTQAEKVHQSFLKRMR